MYVAGTWFYVPSSAASWKLRSDSMVGWCTRALTRASHGKKSALTTDLVRAQHSISVPIQFFATSSSRRIARNFFFWETGLHKDFGGYTKKNLAGLVKLQQKRLLTREPIRCKLTFRANYANFNLSHWINIQGEGAGRWEERFVKVWLPNLRVAG